MRLTIQRKCNVAARTNTIIHFRCRGGKCKEHAHLFPTKMKTRSSFASTPRGTHTHTHIPGDVNASCISKSDHQEGGIDESRCVDDNTGAFPRGRLTRSKMTPRRQRRGGGRGGPRRRGDGGYKGLESRLVDEGDKKFIRRSVGAAPPPPRRVVGVANGEKRRRGKWGRRDEDQSSNTHRKEGAGRRTTRQEGNGRENSNC